MRAAAGVTALLLAATAAIASAASQTYTGEITDDAKAVVKLEVESKNGRRAATRFAVRRLPLRCEGDTNARLERATLEGVTPVSHKGRFALHASNETQKLRVEGRLVGGGKARGSLEYSGRTEFANRTLECRTSGLRWTAAR